MTSTYNGSCHCGGIRFQADINLGQGTTRCNCSICFKTRFWGAVVAPAAFRLLAGSEMLSTYRFGRKREQHPSCTVCGIRPFVIGDSPRRGTFYAVNVACLDCVDDAVLAEAPITYVDGRNDDWDAAPAETRQL
ncbi:hypothetical protein D187_010127 [Cystobacter fuscus DSM 2262]|uniref:CENP-V/GFA domain-containing protein n=1 Tax=Cystobacter fuscus (strain ATCC 25194 / DSM 2262 / NBRC 100088 / M29) TaxID=1242864 RepID=S9QXW5_CYSF2|nr:GFA family protein [Cystobacter fuscus]EPX61508.1 hypothetical protein D187_010127 [Cystobacter fuscus DSM 2262]